MPRTARTWGRVMAVDLVVMPMRTRTGTPNNRLPKHGPAASLLAAGVQKRSVRPAQQHARPDGAGQHGIHGDEPLITIVRIAAPTAPLQAMKCHRPARPTGMGEAAYVSSECVPFINRPSHAQGRAKRPGFRHDWRCRRDQSCAGRYPGSLNGRVPQVCECRSDPADPRRFRERSGCSSTSARCPH